MENITLGQIKDVVLFLVAFIGGIGSLYALLMKGIKVQLQPIKDDLRDEKRERLKSDLTTFIYIADKDVLTNDQRVRAHEEYDDYIKIGGNSWIHDRFETLKKEGKI